MAFSKPLSLVLVTFLFTLSHAAILEVINQCPFTVWAAAVPGGGARLDHGQTWLIYIKHGSNNASRIWARTNCKFNGSGHGHCETGDCAGLFQCQDYGTPPNTLAEYTINQDLDFFDISLLSGFNVGVDFSPTSNQCEGVKCSADINGQCPTELRASAGCNDPCTVFNNDQFCCSSGSCGPTGYSRFFKNSCPYVYTYPLDDANATFSCPSGTNYTVMFCP